MCRYRNGGRRHRFAATKAMTSNKTQNVKKATGKAIKAVGAVIESLQM